MKPPFKIGDKVRRIKKSFAKITIGDVDIVTEVIKVNERDDVPWSISLKRFGFGYDASKFELVEGHNKSHLPEFL